MRAASTLRDLSSALGAPRGQGLDLPPPLNLDISGWVVVVYGGEERDRCCVYVVGGGLALEAVIGCRRGAGCPEMGARTRAELLLKHTGQASFIPYCPLGLCLGVGQGEVMSGKCDHSELDVTGLVASGLVAVVLGKRLLWALSPGVGAPQRCCSPHSCRPLFFCPSFSWEVGGYL